MTLTSAQHNRPWCITRSTPAIRAGLPAKRAKSALYRPRRRLRWRASAYVVLPGIDKLAAEHVAVTSRRRGICVEDLALGHLGVVRRIRQHCQHFLTAAQLVAQGDGLLTLTRNNARLINAGLGNRLLDMPLTLPEVCLNLYWSKQVQNESANRWLREQLLALAGRA